MFSHHTHDHTLRFSWLEAQLLMYKRRRAASTLNSSVCEKSDRSSWSSVATQLTSATTAKYQSVPPPRPARPDSPVLEPPKRHMVHLQDDTPQLVPIMAVDWARGCLAVPSDPRRDRNSWHNEPEVVNVVRPFRRVKSSDVMRSAAATDAGSSLAQTATTTATPIIPTTTTTTTSTTKATTAGAELKRAIGRRAGGRRMLSSNLSARPHASPQDSFRIFSQPSAINSATSSQLQPRNHPPTSSSHPVTGARRSRQMSASTAASRGGHLSKEAKRASATSLFAQLSDLNNSSGKVEMSNNSPTETRSSSVSFELAPLTVPSPVTVPELCRNTLTAKSSTESAWGLIGGQIRGTQLQDPAENTPLESLDGHIPSVNTKTQSQQQHDLTQPPPPLSSPQQCSQPLPPPPPPPQQLAPKNVRTNAKRRVSSTTTSAAVNPENTSPRSPHFSPSMKSYFDDSDDTGDEAMTEATSLSHFMRRYTKGVRPHPATMANTSTTTAATTGNKRFSRDRPHSSRQSFLSGDMNGRGDCGVREAKRMRSDSALGARRAFASASMTDLPQSGGVGVGNVAPTPPLVTGRRRRTRWTHLDHVPPVPPLPAKVMKLTGLDVDAWAAAHKSGRIVSTPASLAGRRPYNGTGVPPLRVNRTNGCTEGLTADDDFRRGHTPAPSINLATGEKKSSTTRRFLNKVVSIFK